MVYEKNDHTFTIEKGCPWYEAQQTFGPPNINWCEPTSCSIVNEPANAWTNFGIIIPALFLWSTYSKLFQNRWMKVYAPMMFFMGLLSFIYHSTNNLATQYLDFFGMFLYTGVIITLNLERATGKVKNWMTYGIVFLINNLIFFLYLKMDWAYQKIILYNIVVMLGLEVYIFVKKKEQKTKYKFLFISLIFWAIAQTFSLLDHTRTWCEPENILFHGHALWHIFSGVGATISFFYFKQFGHEKNKIN